MSLKMSHQNVLSKFLINISPQNFLSKCLIQMSHRNVSSKYCNKTSHQNVSSKCFIKMSQGQGKKSPGRNGLYLLVIRKIQVSQYFENYSLQYLNTAFFIDDAVQNSCKKLGISKGIYQRPHKLIYPQTRLKNMNKECNFLPVLI